MERNPAFSPLYYVLEKFPLLHAWDKSVQLCLTITMPFLTLTDNINQYGVVPPCLCSDPASFMISGHLFFWPWRSSARMY